MAVMVAVQSLGVGQMSGDAGAFPECEVNTLMAPDHTAFQVSSSGYGRARISRFLRKALAQDATRRLWLVVRAAGWLHSKVLH